MAKSNQTETRTAAIDIAPPESVGVLAAWQGLYWAFKGRFEGYDMTPEGIVLKGVTFDGGTNVENLIRDVNRKNRRVPLYPTINYLNGHEPEGFATAQEMTVFGVGNFRGAEGEGSTRVPKYVREAFSRLKVAQGISGRRGPKPRSINLKNLSSLDASTLKSAGVTPEDIQHLISVANEVAASQSAAEVTNA
jgi:hypothetical protein